MRSLPAVQHAHVLIKSARTTTPVLRPTPCVREAAGVADAAPHHRPTFLRRRLESSRLSLVKMHRCARCVNPAGRDVGSSLDLQAGGAETRQQTGRSYRPSTILPCGNLRADALGPCPTRAAQAPPGTGCAAGPRAETVRVPSPDWSSSRYRWATASPSLVPTCDTSARRDASRSGGHRHRGDRLTREHKKCRSPLTFRSPGFDRATIPRRRHRCQVDGPTRLQEEHLARCAPLD
jgi:hypothetical protein